MSTGFSHNYIATEAFIAYSTSNMNATDLHKARQICIQLNRLYTYDVSKTDKRKVSLV
jgi:hypothetical protein